VLLPLELGPSMATTGSRAGGVEMGRRSLLTPRRIA